MRDTILALCFAVQEKIEGVNQTAEDMAFANNQVNTNAAELAGLAKQLKSLVGAFKI